MTVGPHCPTFTRAHTDGDIPEFLATAELADTDFTAEKTSNVQVVHRDQFNPYVLTPDQERKAEKKHAALKANLTVPRRPKWDSTTTPGELDRMERESFLNWRRGLAELQESKDLMMTPFERNLEVWRQLWRVIERSDLVVQIVDARNPLMFRSEDLEKYVKEVDPRKENLLLVNKADLLTLNQRKAWADYFEKEGIAYRFFSAALAREINEAQDDSDYEDYEEESDEEVAEATEKLGLDDKGKGVEEEVEPERTRIITTEELEAIFLENAPDIDNSDPTSKKYNKTTIGLVGYPNVGKSSTINALMGAKKVSVSATPGKTKHFQTLIYSDKVTLCDCPGLVFANFASTKAELVCNGVLPIDQQREYTGPATLVAQRIPQWYMEKLYGIKIITRPLEEGGTGIPTGEEMLVAYARARGFMKTGAGNPDDSRAARYVLKDYVNGKLLYCHPPPADPPIDGREFNEEHYEDDSLLPENRKFTAADVANGLGPSGYSAAPAGEKTKEMDSSFFARDTSGSAKFKAPFARGMQLKPPVNASGKPLSGRKAKTMLAIDNNLSAHDVQQMMGGGKKHFKAGKKERKRLGMDYQM